MRRSYDSDFALYIVPILIPGIIVAILTLFFTLFYSIGFQCPTSLSESRSVRFLTKHTHKVVRMVLGKAFKPGRNDSEDPQPVFYGYQVTSIVVYAFSLIVLEMFLVLTIIFWDKFLFKVTYGCPYNVDVSNLNCYNSTSSNLFNCSDSVNDPNIECYQLIFDWSSAAGTTGGLYILLSFGITCIPHKILKCLVGGSLKRRLLISLLQVIIIIMAFTCYTVFLIKSNFNLGIFLSAVGIFSIFLTVSLIPLQTMNFTKIDELHAEIHVNHDATVNGANESTSLFTQHQT